MTTATLVIVVAVFLVVIGYLLLVIYQYDCRRAPVEATLQPWRCPKCGHDAGPDCTTNHQRIGVKYFPEEGVVSVCCLCGARIVQRPLDAPHVETPGAVSVVEDKP